MCSISLLVLVRRFYPSQRMESSRIILLLVVRGAYFSADEVVIYKAFCIHVAQGHINGAPNETLTHSCRFASLAC